MYNTTIIIYCCNSTAAHVVSDLNELFGLKNVYVNKYFYKKNINDRKISNDLNSIQE